MSTLDLLLDNLDGVRPSGKGFVALCPAHDDKNPSLSVREGDTVPVVIKCHAGCESDDIVRAAGLEPREILGRGSAAKPERQQPVKRKIVAAYNYQDEDGILLYQAVRYEPKGFNQRRPGGQAGWIYNLDGCRLVLYRLPELLAADPEQPVYVSEGEKDVNRLIGLGLVATTSPMGAEKWRPEYSELLRDRHVVILADNDAKGRKHAVQVASSLQGVAASVRAVDLPNLPEKGDVSDWLDDGGTTEELAAIVGATPLWEPSASALATDELDDAGEGDEVTVPPFPTELLPGAFRRLVEQAAAALPCPPDFVATPLLVAAGAVIGNALVIEVKPGWRDGPNLWAAVVGDPGTMKSPALDMATSSLDVIQGRLMREYLEAKKDYDEELRAWETEAKKNNGQPGEKPEKPVFQHVFTANATTEALAPMLAASKGLVYRVDELAGLIGSFDQYRSRGRGSDRPNYLSMWSRNPIKIDRKGSDVPIYVRRPCLSIVGGIQPDMLASVADAEQREDGFVDRFLWSYPDRMTDDWSDDSMDLAVMQDVQVVFDWLYRLEGEPDDYGEMQPRVIRLSDEARELFRDYVKDLRAEINAGDLPGHLVGPWSKLRGQTLRLALVLHTLKCAQEGVMTYEVEAETIADAAELAEYFKAHARRALATVKKVPASAPKPARKIMAALNASPGLTQTEILRHVFGGNAKASDVRAALQSLEMDERVVQRQVANEAGGRPATRWYPTAGVSS